MDMAGHDELHRQVQARLANAEQLYTRGRQQIVATLAAAGVPLTLPALPPQRMGA